MTGSAWGQPLEQEPPLLGVPRGGLTAPSRELMSAEPLQGPCGCVRGLGLLHMDMTSCWEPARGGREARESRGDGAVGLRRGQGGPRQASGRSLRRARRPRGRQDGGRCAAGGDNSPQGSRVGAALGAGFVVGVGPRPVSTPKLRTALPARPCGQSQSPRGDWQGAESLFYTPGTGAGLPQAPSPWAAPWLWSAALYLTLLDPQPHRPSVLALTTAPTKAPGRSKGALGLHHPVPRA